MQPDPETNNPGASSTEPESMLEYIDKRIREGEWTASFCERCGDARTIAELRSGPMKYDPLRHPWPVRCRVCGADLDELPDLPEVDVDPAIAAAANPKRRYIGRAYKFAAHFVAFNPPYPLSSADAEAPAYANIRLVHGLRSIGKYFPRTGHAWVEIGNVVFDAVYQRFYDCEAYYEKYDLVKQAEYTRRETLRLSISSGHAGPWHPAHTDIPPTQAVLP